MAPFAVVVMLPDAGDDPFRVDFQSRTFTTWMEFGAAMEQLEAAVPNWRLVTVCHVEDLPKLMEPPEPPPGLTN